MPDESECPCVVAARTNEPWTLRRLADEGVLELLERHDEYVRYAESEENSLYRCRRCGARWLARSGGDDDGVSPR